MNDQREIVNISLYRGREINKKYLLWYPSTKLPTYSGLDGKGDVLHLDLTGSPGVFSIHQSIRKDLRGVAMRKLEQLV